MEFNLIAIWFFTICFVFWGYDVNLISSVIIKRDLFSYFQKEKCFERSGDQNGCQGLMVVVVRGRNKEVLIERYKVSIMQDE